MTILNAMRFFIFASIAFCLAPVGAASLTAEVDRETVIDGESIVLYISGSDLKDVPDTSLLLPDFRIVQSGVSSSQQVINGRVTRGFKVRLELQAKKTGAATIPSFTIDGVSSDPITVEVVPRGTPGVEPRDKVFAELAVDNNTPYVQQQILLSLKIYDDGNLASADPALTGTGDYQIERLPVGGEQIINKNGIEYRVHTFRYALFPQKSGELVIDSVAIPASIRDKSYGGNLILRNTPTRRIELRTEPYTLQVKPRAADSTADWWLPVNSLQLNHEWSADIKNAQADEPFTLTLELFARGATSAQLPEIKVPDVSGIKIYTDTPVLASQPEQNNLVSVRREKWSVIPTASGSVTLPEIKVKWWDTENDVEKEAVIAAQQLIIGGEEGAAKGAQANTDQNVVDTADNKIEEQTIVADNSEGENKSAGVVDAENSAAKLPAGLLSRNSADRGANWWQYLAIGAMALWLLTIFGWWWSLRSKATETNTADNIDTGETRAFRTVKALSRAHDVSAYSAAVIEWAQLRWPGSSVHNLPAVARRLGSRELYDDMRKLDKVRFAGHARDESVDVSIVDIQRQIEQALKKDTRDQAMSSTHALPQL